MLVRCVVEVATERGLSVSPEKKSSPVSRWVLKTFDGAASMGSWTRKLCLAGASVSAPSSKDS